MISGLPCLYVTDDASCRETRWFLDILFVCSRGCFPVDDTCSDAWIGLVGGTWDRLVHRTVHLSNGFQRRLVRAAPKVRADLVDAQERNATSNTCLPSSYQRWCLEPSNSAATRCIAFVVWYVWPFFEGFSNFGLDKLKVYEMLHRVQRFSSKSDRFW